LRALNKRVIGVGVQASTSPLLPPACDEFLFYEALEGVEMPTPKQRARTRRADAGKAAARSEEPRSARTTETSEPKALRDPEAEELHASINRRLAALQRGTTGDLDELATLAGQTLAGLQRGTGDVVLGSTLKRALLRKDPTFSEAAYGFRTWGELLRFLEERKVIEISQGAAKGDPEVNLPEQDRGEQEVFVLLRDVVAELEAKGTLPLMSGLKNHLRKRQPSFSEKRLGYGGFLQFCKAAQTRGLVTLVWSDEADDYVLHTVPGKDP
jgi:hypothetical protein